MEKRAEHLEQFKKLDNSVPFSRPLSGTVIIQLMTEMDGSNKYTGTAKPQLFRKQSNESIFTSKNRMSQCT